MAYFLSNDSSSSLRHLAYSLFLLSRHANLHIVIADGDFQLAVTREGKEYYFRFVPAFNPQKSPFVHDLYPFTDLFYRRYYDYYDYAGGVVIDVGGYVGETAVYFAKNGASKVHVYEPNPVNYQYLVKNVEINNVSKIVESWNLGISKGKHILVVPKELGGAGSLDRESRAGTSYEVPTSAPRSIFGPERQVSLLKIDCKGC